MVNLNLRGIDEYTNRVLNVIKSKYGLTHKGEALNKLAQEIGDKYIEEEIKEEFVKKITKTINEHEQKYPKRRMSLEELDKLCGISD
ncbi:MAG: hypothetical protein WC356_06255 [Candidatus Micrarchaeia archaeon]|jgi:hypothetical protein